MIAIITNGYYQNKASIHQSQRLYEELSKLGADVKIIKNDAPTALNSTFMFDKAVFFDKDIALLSILEKSGVRVFNTSHSTSLADNKRKTLIELSGMEGFKIPKTMFLPLNYGNKTQSDVLDTVEDYLGYPIVVKKCLGSLGEQVYLAKNRAELNSLNANLSTCEHIYQQAIVDSFGKSIRAYVVGKKLVGAVRYVNKNDFRSNSAVGGLAQAVNLPNSFKIAAENIAKKLNLDYCGVDFFDLDDPVLIEVNSNAYFMAIEEFGINIAKFLAEFIMSSNNNNN